MKLQDKIIVVTGGATGIGKAIISELIDQNTVVSIDRNPEKIKALKATFPTAVSIRADVTNQEQTTQAIEEITRSFKRIDVLINNAGIGRRMHFVSQTAAELSDLLEQEVAINYKAPILLTHKALGLLKQSAEPTVVFVSSGLAHMPIAELAGYCATKSALHFFAMSLRHQLKSMSIRVVEVLPPTVDTDFNKDVDAPKMPVATFARLFVEGLKRNKTVINIGQSKALYYVSRLFPAVAFRMLNRVH